MSGKSNAGLVRKQDGSQVIPSTRRADGSLRKEVKVRPGFVPQEDQKQFVSKRVQQVANYIPGTDRLRNHVVGIQAQESQKPTKKKNKKVSSNQDNEKNDKVSTLKSQPVTEAVEVAQEIQDPKLKAEKKIKALLKKLRQISELEGKAFESLDEAQKLKIQGKPIVEKELNELETLMDSLKI